MDIIFDIDGTLADCSHRRHFVASKPKNWKAFNAGMEKDTLIKPVAKILDALIESHNAIIISTGREEIYKDNTIRWLGDNNIFYHALYMRKAGDYRTDDIVKGEMLDQMIADGYNPVVAFDDRDRVVKLWRSRGLICAQVAEGSF